MSSPAPTPAVAAARAAVADARAAYDAALAALETALRAEAQAEILERHRAVAVRAVIDALERVAAERVRKFTKRELAAPGSIFSDEERAVIADYTRGRLAADAALDAPTIARDALTHGDIEVILEKVVSTEVYSTIEPDGTPKFDAPDADTEDDDAPPAKRTRSDAPARTVSMVDARTLSA